MYRREIHEIETANGTILVTGNIDKKFKKTFAIKISELTGQDVIYLDEMDRTVSDVCFDGYVPEFVGAEIVGDVLHVRQRLFADTDYAGIAVRVVAEDIDEYDICDTKSVNAAMPLTAESFSALVNSGAIEFTDIVDHNVEYFV